MKAKRSENKKTLEQTKKLVNECKQKANQVNRFCPVKKTIANKTKQIPHFHADKTHTLTH